MFCGRAVKAVSSFIPKNAVRSLLWNPARSECISAQEVLHGLPDPEVTALKNGFRVVTENNGQKHATVGVWVDAGVFCEDEDNNGASTFLERLFYKGTQKRSATQLREELNKVEARLCSYVERDRTALYAECASANVKSVVEIIADVLLNSRLDEESIELERSSILKDAEAREEDSHTAVFDFLHKAAFQGTSFARPLTGTTKSIKSMNRNKLKIFREDHYSPSGMVLVGVGNFEHDALVDVAGENFGHLSGGTQLHSWCNEANTRFTGSQMLYRDDSMPFMYGAIAVEGLGYGHSENLHLQIAQTIVGSWNRTDSPVLTNSPSRVVQKVSDISDLHSFQSFNINYKNSGLFGLYFVTEGKNTDSAFELIRAVQREWKHMATGITDDEIDRAKNFLKRKIFSLLESSTTRADNLGRYALCSGKCPPLVEFDDAIEAVYVENLRDAVMNNIYDRDLAAAGIGKTEAFPEYLIARYGMSWWRL